MDADGAGAGGDDDDRPAPPGDLQPPPQPPPAAHSHDTGAEPVVLVEAAAVVSEWLPCVNEHGEAYFCNVGTGETRWQLPGPLEGSATERGEAQAAGGGARVQRKSLQLVQQVMGGAVKRVDRSVQLQLEEARRRHREFEELRDEQVRLGGEHWVEMYDPTHDSFYFYGAFSGDMRWDRPDSYVLKVESDTVLRLVVQLQCAFRMALARRRVFRAKQEARVAQQQQQQQRRESVVAGASTLLCESESAPAMVAAPAAADDDDTEEEAAEASDTVPDGEPFGLLHRGSSHWLSSIPELHQEHDVWVEVYDPLHKLVYYHCAATGETRWDPPSVFVSAAEDKEMAAAIAIQALSRSFLARRGVQQRKLALRRQRQQQAVLEARQLRERRQREFLSQGEGERERMGRREMVEEEMAQLRCGDRFWGVDAHDREVRRQQAEEQLLAMSEAFWQRVNASMKLRSELFTQRAKELERLRHRDESAAEADALAAMAAEEQQQRQLGDTFWGIEGEEQREARARLEMLEEETGSRRFGLEAHARDLRATWELEAAASAVRSERDTVVNEKRHRKQYMKWFYRDCTSVDDLLGYLWPTMRRPAPHTSSGTPAKSGLSSPEQQQQHHSSYLLDDLVVKQRLATGDLRYGNKSIVTIHHANSAQILGRKGGFALELVGGTKAAYEAAMAKYTPPPASPAKPAPPRLDATPEDEEHLRMGTALHYTRFKTPDPHVPARFNGVPFKPSQLSPTRDILCGSHTKLTQLPSLAAKRTSHKTSPVRRSSPPKKTFGKKKHTPTRSNNDDSSSPRTNSLLQRHSALFRRGDDFEDAADESSRDDKSDDDERGRHIPREVLLEQFALEELGVLQRVFALMDYDGSGAVDQQEMAWALQRDEEIAAIASRSALLRVFVKHPAQLNELFERVGGPRSGNGDTHRQQELSWDVFLAFCQRKYVDLMASGALKAPRGSQPLGESREERARSPLYREDEEEAKIRALFALLDYDANGVLEIDELQAALADAANDREIGQLVRSCRALQPLVHQATFTAAFRQFAPEDPRGISADEFVAFCLEIAAIAQFNGWL